MSSPKNTVLQEASKCCTGPFCAGANSGQPADRVLDRLRGQGVLFARKFDSRTSAGLLDAIDAWAAADELYHKYDPFAPEG